MSTELGKIAEQAVASYLEERCFRVQARNWRNRWCEIDILATRGPELHVVEVKYRSSHYFGGGLGAITHDKAARLIRAAQAFSRQPDQPVIIDVAAISGHPGNWQIELVENALELA